MNNKKGFIAIETIITAGLMIALAAFGFNKYLDIALGVTDHANVLINSVKNIEIN